MVQERATSNLRNQWIKVMWGGISKQSPRKYYIRWSLENRTNQNNIDLPANLWVYSIELWWFFKMWNQDRPIKTYLQCLSNKDSVIRKAEIWPIWKLTYQLDNTKEIKKKEVIYMVKISEFKCVIFFRYNKF